jgi:hypothetical protein
MRTSAKSSVSQVQNRNAPVPAADASHASAILRRGTVRSTVALFAAYGVRLTPAPPLAELELGDIEFLSVAGFSGPDFSGFVVLGTSENMLHRSNSTTSTSSDWMAELGNQLLGRIKNSLLREGISIHRVPPAVVRGTAGSMLCARIGTKPVAFIDNQEIVLIWTEFEPSVELAEARTPDADVLAEGDMVLF